MAKNIPGLNFNLEDATARALSMDANAAIINQLQSIQGRDGMVMQLFLNSDDIDKTIETSINCIAEVNGNMREAPFNNNIPEWFQRDRANDAFPRTDGVLQPAYKPYYGEVADTWNVAKFAGSNFEGAAWDDARKIWWAVNGASKQIIKISEDFKESYGWWTIDNATNLCGICIDGNNMYVTDYNYGTYGRITKHIISADGALVGGEISGSTISDSSSILGTASYNDLWAPAVDDTHIYVTCFTTDNIGKIDKSAFATWDSSIDISDYVTTLNARGIVYDGTDLFISDISTDNIIKIKKDGSIGYNLFKSTYSPRSLAIKNGDLYVSDEALDTVSKVAIKNTRTLEGQAIKVIPQTEDLFDMCFIEDLFGVDAHGYLAVTQTANREIKVYDVDFVEVTSGAIQTTTPTDSSGYGVTSLLGIDCDGTNVVLSSEGTTDCILEIALSDIDGSYALQAADVKINTSGQNPRKICYIPNETDKVVYFRQASNCYTEGDLSGGTFANAFEKSIYHTEGASLAFNPNNSRQLYMIDYVTDNVPLLVIDYPMSRYMGDGNQPYTIKTIGILPNESRASCFDENGDWISVDSSNGLTYKLAVASSDDNKVTGEDQRNVRYYGNTIATSFKTYPGTDINSAACKKAIRYRRKYDPSVYSDQNNVLPLDGLYICKNTGVAIIDLETNTEFMIFNNAVSALNQNMIDASNSVLTYRDIFICDDKLWIASSSDIYHIDFVNDDWCNISTGGKQKNTTINSIAERNMSATSISYEWNNTNMGITNNDVGNIHGKQDTTIDPKYHNGSETSIDNSEIYLGYGTAGGDGLIKWKAGVSYYYNTSGYHSTYIADDFSIFSVYHQTTSGNVQLLGDCRKIYADQATKGWNLQTGTYKIFDTELSYRYINNIDIKTIWKNGVANNYIAVAEGQVAVSTPRAVEVIDINNEQIEIVYYNSSSGAGNVGAAWGKDNELYSCLTDNTGTSRLQRFTRKDFIANTGYNWEWMVGDTGYTSIHDEYYQLPDDLRNVTYSHNTICISGDDGVTIIELPRQDSFIENLSVDGTPDDPNKVFMVKNEFVSEKVGDYWYERVIKSDCSDSGYTYTNGSTDNWDAIINSPTKFGGNARQVQGQSGGGTQPKVEFTTEDNCTELSIYFRRAISIGRVDINVTNTSGAVNIIYDGYSAETVEQDIVAIKGLDAEIHTVTITTRDDKNALSGGYYTVFCSHVEVIKTATAKVKGSITHEISFDSGSNWLDISTSDAQSQIDIKPGQTPDGTVKKRTTFDVNNSDVLYVNDEGPIFLE